ncbi:MAG: YceI family protein, partial [Ignavibacteria bacterium]|nr:YceI family protein [Ignavibacteria bacterium]
MKRVQLAVAVLALLPALLFGQTKWKFDQAHSGIGFSVSHMVISEVTGNFRSFDGNVASAKDNDFSDAKVDFVVKVGSVNTDNEKRDQHLKSE